MSGLPLDQIIVGDAAAEIARLPEGSVDSVITSPPYFRLRDYGHDRQLGLEPNVDEWVDELMIVMTGLRRVLKPTGSLWLNLGDTYARKHSDGAPPKSLLLGPERLALRMVAAGWTLRNKVVWSKPNPMPTSVRDRLACTWEVVYFFTPNARYHFDLDSIRIPHTSKRVGRNTGPAGWSVPPEWRGPSAGTNSGLGKLRSLGLPGHPLGKNPGDFWSVPTASYRGAHHAVFPPKLIERPIESSCPPGGVVLDPFIGAGTTAIAAESLGRRWIGIELNPTFAANARTRIEHERQQRKQAA